jgi:tetratricopeptide (TPR) repeat protein
MEVCGMSFRPMPCPQGHGSCAFGRIGLLPDQTSEGYYGVTWRCPTCGHTALDVCPVGPLVPRAGACLNCGAALGGAEACPSCGMDPAEMAAIIGLAEVPADPCALANEAFRQGLYRRGMAVINYALRLDPGLEQAWLFKAGFLDALGFRASKRDMLRQALAAGAPAVLAVNYGNALCDEGRYLEAVQAHQLYLDRQPNGTDAALARYNQANAYFFLGQYEPAERLYREALAREPQRHAFAYMLAHLMRRRGRGEEALAVINRALEHPGQDRFTARLYEERGYVFAEQQRGEDSLRDADQALALGGETPSARYLRGRALALLGRLAEARDEMQRVLRQDPSNADAQRGLRMIDEALPRPSLLRRLSSWWKPKQS